MKTALKNKRLLHQIRAYLKTFRWFNPTNLEEERVKFFKILNYNPQLTYPPPSLDKLKKYQEALEGIQLPDAFDLTSIIQRKKIKETKLKLALIFAKGTSQVTSISARLYQLNFNDENITSAQKDAVAKIKLEPQENLDSRQAAKAISAYLKTYLIDDWKIHLSERSDFYFQVMSNKRLISIGRNLNWHANYLDSTLAHEIDGHVVRAINAKKQAQKIFRKKFPFYIKTEEGLASYLGGYLSENGQLYRKHQAVKYLAGYYALTHSFRETYNFLLDRGFTKELAFQRAFRLKRGFTDTSQPGCFAREAMYYEGMLEVKKYLDEGGDIRKLYAGKVGLDDVDVVPIPQNQILPKRLKKNN